MGAHAARTPREKGRADIGMIIQLWHTRVNAGERDKGKSE
jgi:hypothetical protein